MSELLDKQATLYEQAAQELDLAAKHLRVTAEHFRNHEVPRACAHIFASQGHLFAVKKIIEEHAVLHASKARA
jgi:ABC-type bacteriocin/lantibiotic exporter with double-glycine peptidase domain